MFILILLDPFFGREVRFKHFYLRQCLKAHTLEINLPSIYAGNVKAKLRSHASCVLRVALGIILERVLL